MTITRHATGCPNGDTPNHNQNRECLACPRPSHTDALTTEDNRTPIVEGMRLFNYYDRKWGVVADLGSDGWFVLIQDDGTRANLNGARVSTVEV